MMMAFAAKGMAVAVAARSTSGNYRATYRSDHMAGTPWTSIEWTAFGAVLSGAGTVIGAVAVIGAAWLASNTFEGWRKQTLSQRRIEQAERILTAAYKARRALVSAQGYYNRMNAVLDERRAVEECLPMARALFGEKVEKALELLNRQFRMVEIAVDSDSMEGNDREFARSLREDISSAAGSDRPNKMNVLIEEQVKLIEDALVPVLRLEK
jgi:hypothetical protein